MKCLLLSHPQKSKIPLKKGLALGGYQGPLGSMGLGRLKSILKSISLKDSKTPSLNLLSPHASIYSKDYS